MPAKKKWNFDWSGRMEQLEERLAMSADPLGGLLGGSIEHHAINDAPPGLVHHTESTPDFWIDSTDQDALNNIGRQIDQALEDAHGQTGLLDVRANYGFTGIGQTVAVIDSGIAYDHFALGGGLGSNYRVVGGWDFTGENDADPYDDGPSGAHGTHVAGIVGGDSGNDTGVAPGVDLVALRVFDDAGAGYFSWVENALEWIHDNRNSFENPITAVNLSLGVSSWNSDTVPAWANLEDEFAQLEADGIFISVSAGNSFTSYNEAGLSYPAASSYVVPVMSTDDSGLMSYFSQRHSRAIAAPGRWITSTVPDYAGNNNGQADDYATMSGTSMAAPYVAGASVIIREAMEFAGYTNITQDTIYDHMIATADSFYDSATNQSYSRLNVQAAVDALMPADDFGSDIASAYSLGTLNSTLNASGVIGTVDDSDFFSFTAGSTGTVSMSVSNTTHELVTNCSVVGAVGTLTNNILTFDVTEGQNYTVSIETMTGNGIGYYDTELSLEVDISEPYVVKSVERWSGVIYSLDSEGWLSINNNRLWANTADFSVAANQHFVWQGTNGILQRFTDGGWSTFDRNATKHIVNSKSHVYSLGDDNLISLNGKSLWSGTNDFHISNNDTIYWHSSSGVLQKLPNGGPWQTLDRDVEEFAVRHDGVAFAFTSDGNVTVDSVQTWSGISDIYLDNSGGLVLASNGGGFHYEAGTFSLSKSLPLQTSQLGFEVASEVEGGSPLAAFSHEKENFFSTTTQESLKSHFPESVRIASKGYHTGNFDSVKTSNYSNTQLNPMAGSTTARDRAYSAQDLLVDDSIGLLADQFESNNERHLDALFDGLGDIWS